MTNEMFMRARAMKAYEKMSITPPIEMREAMENDKFFIGRLKEPYQTIMWMRYVEGMRWGQIADATYYAESYVQRKAREAEKMLKEIKGHVEQS